MTTGGYPDATIKQMRQDLLAWHNKYRYQRGKPSMSLDYELQRGAQAYADYMARTGNYGHSNVLQPSSWHAFENYTDSKGWGGGENVARGATTVAAIMATSGRTWRTSCGHYYNYITKAFRHIGFGISRSSYGVFWCARMGGPTNSYCKTSCPGGCEDHNFYSNDSYKLPYG
jgi:uncharacterized protein YkwD